MAVVSALFCGALGGSVVVGVTFGDGISLLEGVDFCICFNSSSGVGKSDICARRIKTISAAAIGSGAVIASLCPFKSTCQQRDKT